MDVVKFGAFLKQLRKEKGFTQEQLAEQFRVTNRTISRWETGTNLPDIDMLIALSDFYEIDIRELLEGERQALKTKPEELELAMKISDYSLTKEKHFIGKVFMTTIAAIVSIGISFFTTLTFLNDVIGGSVVLLTSIISFLFYCLAMQGFQVCKSTKGYLTILTSGVVSILLCNIFILGIFFPTGSYYNYGLLGLYYVVGINIATFSTVGIVTKVLCIRKNEVK